MIPLSTTKLSTSHEKSIINSKQRSFVGLVFLARVTMLIGISGGFGAVAWGLQIIEKTSDVIVAGAAIKNIETKEGYLKLREEPLLLDVFAQSQFTFNTETHELKLQAGRIRIRSTSQNTIKVETPVGFLTLSAGDILVHYNHTQARAHVEVLEGTALIQGFYRDEVLNVQKGESGQFLGVAEAGGPAFDLLLKGRKSVRGHLDGPIKMSEIHQLELINQYDIKPRPILKKSKPKPKPGQICTEPFARYNECVWRCLNNPSAQKKCLIDIKSVRCRREKCLADGTWGDSQELNGLSKKSCQDAGATVGPCTY